MSDPDRASAPWGKRSGFTLEKTSQAIFSSFSAREIFFSLIRMRAIRIWAWASSILAPAWVKRTMLFFRSRLDPVRISLCSVCLECAKTVGHPLHGNIRPVNQPFHIRFKGPLRVDHASFFKAKHDFKIVGPPGGSGSPGPWNYPRPGPGSQRPFHSPPGNRQNRTVSHCPATGYNCQEILPGFQKFL